jgi:hypothetical protein
MVGEFRIRVQRDNRQTEWLSILLSNIHLIGEIGSKDEIFVAYGQ